MIFNAARPLSPAYVSQQPLKRKAGSDVEARPFKGRVTKRKKKQHVSRAGKIRPRFAEIHIPCEQHPNPTSLRD